MLMAFPESRVSPLVQRIGLPALTGIAYYAAAAISLYLTRGSNGIATYWPPSGILFAVLLVVPPRRAGAHVAAAATASLLANVGAGITGLTAIGFTAANMAESVLAAWLLRTRARCRVTFTEPGGLICFCMAATVGTMTSATIATLVGPTMSIDFWFSWFATDLLGILVVTPLLLIASIPVQQRGIHRTQMPLLDILAVFGMVALVAGLTFWQLDYPLLFVPMVAVLVAVFRLGPVGAAGGVLIVAAISSTALRMGIGPMARVDGGTEARSLFLQFYLLALFAAALPVAALLASRQRLAERLAGKMRLLELAESAAQVGHWRLDTGSGTVTWSREVFRIHGLTHDVSPALDDAIKAYHIEDRALVTERLEEAIRGNHGFAFSARIVRPDGEIRHVFSRGEIDHCGEDGRPGLFGIIQDITAQVAHEAALHAARLAAEAAAAQATILAETDQLTGIANRRRTSLALEQAVDAARASGRPVSIAMFDIDHFKQINDTYGHQAGDEVLKRVAADAGGQLRSGDTIGRFGGEEFVIVLPDTPASAAMSVAERVRAAIQAGGDNPCVTISIGVAEQAPGETCDTLLRRADQALYAAKREGRNLLRLAA